MKILKIELQNINSLKSEFPIVIDFEQPEFKDIGLYAITGSTGAGKTTILDAITIALYHRVPRFNKSNIKAGLFDVVSHGSSEAMSRVTFLSKNEIYEAQWTLRIKGKTGKPLANPVESVRLKNLSHEKIIGEKKTEVQKAIIETTQLNYDQFLRSVLLAQGEFAAFLSANAKDKGTLLEQITGEEIYKKIGNLISDKIYAEKKILEEKKSRINTEDLLSEKEKLELTLRLEDVINTNKDLEIKLLNHQTKANWFNKKSELDSQQALWIEKNKIFLSSQTESKSIIESLINHKSALPYSIKLTNLIRLEQEKTELCLVKEKLLLNHKVIEELVKTNTEIVSKGKIEFEKVETLSKIWQPKLDRVTLLDNSKQSEEKNINKIIESISILNNNEKSENNKRQELEQLREKEIQTSIKLDAFLEEKKLIPEFEKHYNEWNTKLTERKICFESRVGFQKNEADLKQELILVEKNKDKKSLELNSLKLILKKLETNIGDKKSKIDANSIEKNANLLHKIESDITTWDNVNIHLTNWKYQSKQKQNLVEKSIELLKQLDNNTKEHEQLSIKNKAFKVSLNDAIRIFDQSQLIKRFETERLDLKPDTPCSLCGSKTHPFIEHYDPNTINSDKRLVEERTQAYEKSERILQENRTSNILLTKELETIKSRIIEVDLEIKKWLEILEKNAINPTVIDLDNIEDNIRRLLTKKKTLESVLKELISETKLVENLEKDLANKRENLVLIEKTCAVLVEKENQYNHQLKLIKQNSSENNTRIEGLENELETTFSILKISLPTYELTDHFLDRLKKSISVYNENVKLKNIVKTTIEKIEIEYKASSNILIKIQNQASELKKEKEVSVKTLNTLTLERMAILPKEISVLQKRETLDISFEKVKNTLKKSQENHQNSITEKTLNSTKLELNSKQIARVEKNHNELSQEFKIVIKESKFDSINEINQAILSAEIENQYQNKQDKLKQTEAELNSKKIELDEKLNQLNAEHNFSETKSDLEESTLKIKEQKEQVLKEMGSIKTKFDLDKQIIERNSDVVTEIKIQEKIYHKWSHLMNLLGGSKHAFNTYVQRLTLKSLIDLANIHLYKLNKRYSLKMEETYKTGEELNFKLVDHYQTDITRFVDTSSGGEKFLISLALALGLSDLSSKNVQIGSLFIDEGFGTLDQNTLETVISTLETLQAQGKMIGIISHVENLKERISTQIKVIKKSNGVSTVEIV